MSVPEAKSAVSAEHIAAVRRFNRFHTRLVGALADRMSYADYPLPQVRIVYELANSGDAALSASALGRELGMDTGYMSRLITALEKDGLIERQPDPENARRLLLALTPQGRELYRSMDAASACEVAALLADLSVREQAELAGAMDKVRGLLGDAPRGANFILRDPAPGDIGWIVSRQGRLYANEYGWDWTFEGFVAEIAGGFVRTFDPRREKCWIAEREGEIIGAVFVVREDATTAKLRMLYVEPSARGLGLGRRLVEECLRFARERGYTRMVLWTNDILAAARRIYETTGFELVREEPHRSFGKDLVGQYWARDL